MASARHVLTAYDRSRLNERAANYYGVCFVLDDVRVIYSRGGRYKLQCTEPDSELWREFDECFDGHHLVVECFANEPENVELQLFASRLPEQAHFCSLLRKLGVLPWHGKLLASITRDVEKQAKIERRRCELELQALTVKRPKDRAGRAAFDLQEAERKKELAALRASARKIAERGQDWLKPFYARYGEPVNF